MNEHNDYENINYWFKFPSKINYTEYEKFLKKKIRKTIPNIQYLNIKEMKSEDFFKILNTIKELFDKLESKGNKQFIDDVKKIKQENESCFIDTTSKYIATNIFSVLNHLLEEMNIETKEEQNEIVKMSIDFLKNEFPNRGKLGYLGGIEIRESHREIIEISRAKLFLFLFTKIFLKYKASDEDLKKIQQGEREWIKNMSSISWHKVSQWIRVSITVLTISFVLYYFLYKIYNIYPFNIMIPGIILGIGIMFLFVACFIGSMMLIEGVDYIFARNFIPPEVFTNKASQV
jgi:hypothetical protein